MKIFSLIENDTENVIIDAAVNENAIIELEALNSSVNDMGPYRCEIYNESLLNHSAKEPPLCAVMTLTHQTCSSMYNLKCSLQPSTTCSNKV